MHNFVVVGVGRASAGCLPPHPWPTNMERGYLIDLLLDLDRVCELSASIPALARAKPLRGCDAHTHVDTKTEGRAAILRRLNTAAGTEAVLFSVMRVLSLATDRAAGVRRESSPVQREKDNRSPSRLATPLRA